MSNLYGIVPKLLTWIIIDEVDLHLPCGVCVSCNELSFKILIHVDFNLLSFIQLSALVGK